MPACRLGRLSWRACGSGAAVSGRAAHDAQPGVSFANAFSGRRMVAAKIFFSSAPFNIARGRHTLCLSVGERQAPRTADGVSFFGWTAAAAALCPEAGGAVIARTYCGKKERRQRLEKVRRQ